MRLVFLNILFFFFFVSISAQTNISGVINSYSKVNSFVSSNSLRVDNALIFNVGDTVLLIQMKGAEMVKTNNASFGDLVNINNAGHYELLIVESRTLILNIISFTCNFTNTYSESGYCQLIKVPTYTNATINSTLTSADWDGEKGGVLAMIVENTLTFNANIDLAGKGFKGGQPKYNMRSHCSGQHSGYFSYRYSNLSDSAGFKGESIFVDTWGLYALGRGKSITGGGGGNTLNAAGGGGSNAGKGGKGAREASYCSPANDVGGIGGQSLIAEISNNRIFMGGGGGGGTSEIISSDPLPGANGGGIVIIIANKIVGNNRSVIARGHNVPGTTVEESAGGGGGGGTIVFFAAEVNGALNLIANGGSGGSAQGGAYSSCRGSGGGGGGGAILYNLFMNAPIIFTNIQGGLAGNTPCPTTHKGEDGQQGLLSSESFISLGCLIFNYTPNNSIQASQSICSGNNPNLITGTEPVLLENYDFLWQYSTDGIIWSNCPGINNEYSYQPQNLITTTWFRRKMNISEHSHSSNIVKITVNPNPEINASINHISCKGYNDGKIIINTENGTQPYTYSWNVGNDSSAIDNLAQGNYSVTVTDSLDCIVSFSTEITEPDSLITYVSNINHVTCAGYNNASIFVQSHGGNPPYNYIWEGGVTDDSLINVSGGHYHVTVVDFNSCSNTTTAYVEEPFPIQAYVSQISHVTCHGFSDGEITISANGGIGSGYTYLWSTGDTTATISGLSQNYYYFTATDANGCTGFGTALVLEPPAIQIDFQNINYPNYSFSNNGEIYASVTGGTAPYSYLWSTGATGQLITGLLENIYYLSITDDNNCVYTDTFNLAALFLNPFINGDTILCDNESGKLWVEGLIATTPVASYSWSTGHTTDTISFNLANSQYVYVTITFVSEPMFIDSIFVVIEETPIFTIQGNLSVCEGDMVNLAVVPESSSYTYLWTTGDTTSTTEFIAVSNSSVSVKVNNSHCFSIDTVNINVSPSFDLFISGKTILCQLDTAWYKANTNIHPDSAVNYTWNIPFSAGNKDTVLLWGLLDGNYTIYVTVTSGLCSKVDSIDILIKPRPFFKIEGDSVICMGNEAALSINPDNNFNTLYIWSNGKFGKNISVSPPQTTTFWAATTYNGCPWADTFEVFVNLPPNIAYVIGDTICNGQSGYIRGEVNGIPPFELSYSTSGQANNYTFNTNYFEIEQSPSITSTYLITAISDASGCDNQIIEIPVEIIVSSDIYVFAGNDTIVCGLSCNLNASGNGSWISPAGISLSPSHNNPKALVTANSYGDYVLIWEVNNSGCIGHGEVKITFNAEPHQPFAGNDMELTNTLEVYLEADPAINGIGTWHTLEGSGQFEDINNPNTFVSGLSNGINVFRWNVINPPCLPKYDDVTIHVLALTIPSGFSPNGDGINDVFEITGIDLFPDVSVEVFNRWGIVVYNSTNYDNSWDGRDNTGQLLPEDTYFYIVKINDNQYLRGYVVIKR